jgi:hypothetical protein
MTDTAHWNDRLREVLDDRPVVVVMDVLVGAWGTASQLAELGVRDLLLVAGTRGVGELPHHVEADAVLLDVRRGATMMQGIRAWQAALDDLPADAHRHLDRFDPAGRAWVVGPLFMTQQEVAGRPVLGARPAAWQALEDKTTVDALWDAAAVPRAPSRLVDLHDPAAVASAATDLDHGAGTCWVADNSSGWHGGGEYVRWTGPTGDPTTAVAELAADSRRARVMPFLEGRPCSVHGWAFDDHVAALRPCEMVVWRAADHRFVYGGASTVWEPPTADREEMRDVARRVGRHLRDTVGYRGTFAVDGVLTADGFRPTELNPRFGGALSRVGAGIDLPLYLLHLATVSRPDLDWRPRDLEAAVLAAADAHPVGRVMLELPPEAISGTWRLARDGGGAWVDVDEGTDHEVLLEVGPAVSTGRLAMAHLTGLPRGASAAVAALDLLPAVAARTGVDIARMDAAVERRP